MADSIDEPFEMIVDRPFLAALSDRLTEEVLFIGVIGDPTAALLTAP